MKVLLVEDDRDLAESLLDYLAMQGIEAEWLEDERETDRCLMLKDYDVVILDLMLKYRKGEDILRDLRLSGVDIPVLVLTAKRGISDKEACFELGADDYLVKPFDPKELVLRLRALQRRRGGGRWVSIGPMKMDIDRGVLLDEEGKEVALPKRMRDLLFLLAKNKGRTVTKDQILAYVWGDSLVNEEIVRAYVKKLREVLPRGSIETIKGRGYRLR